MVGTKQGRISLQGLLLKVAKLTSLPNLVSLNAVKEREVILKIWFNSELGI